MIEDECQEGFEPAFQSAQAYKTCQDMQKHLSAPDPLSLLLFVYR